MKDVFEIKPLTECTVEQACEYLAFGWEPLDEDFEILVDRDKERLKARTEENIDSYIDGLAKGVAKLKILLKNKVDLFSENKKIFLLIDFLKLKKAVEITEKESICPIIKENNYTTPYLTLLNTMIEKEYVTESNQPLADNLKEDIKKEGEAMGVKISNRMAESMATILRPLEAQKGGLKKAKH